MSRQVKQDSWRLRAVAVGICLSVITALVACLALLLDSSDHGVTQSRDEAPLRSSQGADLEAAGGSGADEVVAVSSLPPTRSAVAEVEFRHVYRTSEGRLEFATDRWVRCSSNQVRSLGEDNGQWVIVRRPGAVGVLVNLLSTSPVLEALPNPVRIEVDWWTPDSLPVLERAAINLQPPAAMACIGADCGTLGDALTEGELVHCGAQFSLGASEHFLPISSPASAYVPSLAVGSSPFWGDVVRLVSARWVAQSRLSLKAVVNASLHLRVVGSEGVLVNGQASVTATKAGIRPQALSCGLIGGEAWLAISALGDGQFRFAAYGDGFHATSSISVTVNNGRGLVEPQLIELLSASVASCEIVLPSEVAHRILVVKTELGDGETLSVPPRSLGGERYYSYEHPRVLITGLAGEARVILEGHHPRNSYVAVARAGTTVVARPSSGVPVLFSEALVALESVSADLPSVRSARLEFLSPEGSWRTLTSVSSRMLVMDDLELWTMPIPPASRFRFQFRSGTSERTLAFSRDN